MPAYGCAADGGADRVTSSLSLRRNTRAVRVTSAPHRRPGCLVTARIPLQVDRAVQHDAGHADGDGQLLHHADRTARHLPRHRRQPAAAGEHHRFGARPFATGGMVVAAVSFVLLELLPTSCRPATSPT